VLLPPSLPPLNQLISVLNQYPGMIIELSGHTDNIGDTKQNVLLSQQRVATVKEYLVENGISADRIKTVGYGEKYPIVSNDGEQTRKFNRRVEMRIIKM
jgi:outer membrane protein OmpA-like peptidoglycan-associated protein